MEDAIREFIIKIRKQKRIRKNKTIPLRFLKYAAILILTLGLPLSYYIGTRSVEPNISMTTLSCAYGDKATVILPDGSEVWLNSGSKITFNADFKNVERKVFLEGEAFFSVYKDRNHPFQVKTKDIDIEVLGTTFNVKAFPEENSTSTTLVSGSLMISSPFEKIRIKPDQKVVFSKESKKMVLTQSKDLSEDIEWKNGRLVFRDKTLNELIPNLKRWFDVEFVFADEKVKQRRFTGVLERESIQDVVYFINVSKYVSCHFSGNKIIIESEN
ncbi:MAG: FecR domain-containing protein [Ferruginibacter sp.]